MANARPQKPLKFKDENMDVYKILCNKNNFTQYVCDAVRFYEEHLNLKQNTLKTATKIDENVNVKLEDIKNQLQRIEDKINGLPKDLEQNNILVDPQLVKQILNEDD